MACLLLGTVALRHLRDNACNGGQACVSRPPLAPASARMPNPLSSRLPALPSPFPSAPQHLQMLGMHGTVFANYAVDQVRLAEKGHGVMHV